ncbi:MAG: hypothetical protein RLZZ293_1324 [Pseudomonadota bacterium]|jgi:hypothetical protein
MTKLQQILQIELAFLMFNKASVYKMLVIVVIRVASLHWQLMK